MNKDKLEVRVGDLVIDRFELFRPSGVGLVVAPAKIGRSGPIKGTWMVYFFKLRRAYRYAEHSLILLPAGRKEAGDPK